MAHGPVPAFFDEKLAVAAAAVARHANAPPPAADPDVSVWPCSRSIVLQGFE